MSTLYEECLTKMKLYKNGTFITMDEENPTAEAVLVADGIIKQVGSEAEILSTNPNAEIIDLKGKTMLPGFVDSHSHLITTAILNPMPDLSPAPVGDVNSIEDIITKLKNIIKTNNIPDGSVIMARGYDSTLMSDNRELTRHDLDKVSKKHAIYIFHCSLHTAVVNTFTLEKLGYDENTPDPVGGAILREDDTNYPNGILEENAHIQASGKLLPSPKPEDFIKMIIDGQDLYASYGITTVQEGGLDIHHAKVLKEMSDRGIMKLDVVGYQLVHSKDDVIALKERVENLVDYVNKYRLGGIKVLLDGSPQAKTAWVSKPYETPPEGKSTDYSGYPAFPKDETLVEIFKEAMENNIQVLVHTNGDQASEQLINCYEAAINEIQKPLKIRPVMIHAQLLRDDQLDRMKKINMIPSFFSMHTYFWGDLHRKSFGDYRAMRISPAMSALKRDIPFTIHSDSPVLPPDMMLNVWTAVNRISRNGVVIGEEQKISVMEALKAITIYAAYQYGEEESKGSITVGKRADLTIVEKNPLEVMPEELINIKVIETIKDGKTIYLKK